MSIRLVLIGAFVLSLVGCLDGSGLITGIDRELCTGDVCSEANGSESDTVPEAISECDSTGCTIAVTDPTSAVYGLELVIPPGALSSAEQISLSLSDIDATVPEGYSASGKAVDLHPDGLIFNSFIAVKIPASMMQDSAVLHYHKGSWESPSFVGTDSQSGSAVFLLEKFSSLHVVQENQSSLSIDTGFDQFKDTFPLNNFDNECLGMAEFAGWYFLNQADRTPLRTAYSCGSARAIMDAAQEEYSGHEVLVGLADRVGGNLGVSWNITLRNIVATLRLGRPAVLMMSEGLAFGSKHAVLAYKYENDELYIYDPNKPCEERSPPKNS